MNHEREQIDLAEILLIGINLIRVLGYHGIRSTLPLALINDALIERNKIGSRFLKRCNEFVQWRWTLCIFADCPGPRP